MLARAKRIYILMIKVNKLFFLFSLQYFLKEIEKKVSVFLSSYRNTHENLGELEKLWKHSPNGSCSHSISGSPKLSLIFLINSIETGTCSLFPKQ